MHKAHLSSGEAKPTAWKGHRSQVQNTS